MTATWCSSTSTTSPLGAPMCYRAAKGFFERLAKDCGFPVRPHMLRHTAATNWVRAGVDLDVVQRLLGHASPGFETRSTCTPGTRTSAGRWKRSQPGSATGEPTARCALSARFDARGTAGDRARWLEWLRGPCRCRPGAAASGTSELWLFTGDLASDRTAAWPCRTPGCPSADPSSQRALRGPAGGPRVAAGVPEEEFDRQPQSPARPACRAWGMLGGRLPKRAPQQWPVLPARARLGQGRGRRAARRVRGPGSAVAAGRAPVGSPAVGGSASTGRGLCRFHDQPPLPPGPVGPLSEDDMAAWAAAERPGSAYHQFSLAGLAELLRASSCSTRCNAGTTTPPPLDPLQVRILVSRLAGAGSVRHVRPGGGVRRAAGCNTTPTIRGLFRDLRRYLGPGLGAHTPAPDPCAGDVWEVALLGLAVQRQSPCAARPPRGHRFSPGRAGHGCARCSRIGPRSTRPYLQTVPGGVRACRVASQTLVAAGRTDPAGLGAGDFARVVDAICSAPPRRRQLVLGQPPQLVALSVLRGDRAWPHQRADGRGARPVPAGETPHRVSEEPNEDQLGKALPGSVIRQLDGHLDLLGPAGRSGSMSAADLKADAPDDLPGVA